MADHRALGSASRSGCVKDRGKVFGITIGPSRPVRRCSCHQASAALRAHRQQRARKALDGPTALGVAHEKRALGARKSAVSENTLTYRVALGGHRIMKKQ